MKIKKLKNYIVAFVFVVLGVLTLSTTKVSAYTIYDNFGVNENVIYSTEDDIRSIYLYGNSNNTSQMSVYYYNRNTNNYVFYPTCQYVQSAHTILCGNTRITGVFGANTYSTSINDLTLVLVKGNDATFDRIEATFDDGDYFVFLERDEYSLGYEFGYQVGEDIGYENGYDIGFERGADSSNTLVSMIGSIFTGPVTMLTTIFDFDFLGINLTGLILSLTTLLVVIWLVKKFI